MPEPDRHRRQLLIGVTTMTVPLAMALETLMGRLLFPQEFDEVRRFLRDDLTTATWVLLALTLVAALGGWLLQRRLVARARHRCDDSDDQALERSLLGAFLIAACVPQTPSIVATFGFLFGAELLPVALSVLVSTLAVGAQGATLPTPGSAT